MGVAVAGIDRPGERLDPVLNVEAMALDRAEVGRGGRVEAPGSRTDAMTAACLGAIQRPVGAAHQAPGLDRVTGELGDAGAEAHRIARRAELEPGDRRGDATEDLRRQTDV